MKSSTALAIAWALKLGLAAVFSAFVVGNVAGALLGALFAYCLVVAYPRPFTTLRESLRLNWRGFCMVAGLIGVGAFAVLDHGQLGAEAKVVLHGLSGSLPGCDIWRNLRQNSAQHGQRQEVTASSLSDKTC